MSTKPSESITMPVLAASSLLYRMVLRITRPDLIFAAMSYSPLGSGEPKEPSAAAVAAKAILALVRSIRFM